MGEEVKKLGRSVKERDGTQGVDLGGCVSDGARQIRGRVGRDGRVSPRGHGTAVPALDGASVCQVSPQRGRVAMREVGVSEARCGDRG